MGFKGILLLRFNGMLNGMLLTRDVQWDFMRCSWDNVNHGLLIRGVLARHHLILQWHPLIAVWGY